MQEPVTDLVLEAPAGLIRIRCECEDGKVQRVKLINQPAFCYHLDAPIEVQGLGTVIVDVAFGGMTFAFVDAAALGYQIVQSEASELCALGERIEQAAAEQLKVAYPGNPDMPGITITQFTGPIRREAGTICSRTTAIVSPGRCDRSPCGTGSSARLAVMHAKGQIAVGETLEHESITGSRFECKVEAATQVGSYPAIIPSIAGEAWITGLSQIGVDPSDPYPEGFNLAG